MKGYLATDADGVKAIYEDMPVRIKFMECWGVAPYAGCTRRMILWRDFVDAMPEYIRKHSWSDEPIVVNIKLVVR